MLGATSITTTLPAIAGCWSSCSRSRARRPKARLAIHSRRHSNDLLHWTRRFANSLSDKIETSLNGSANIIP